jgi:2-isopropylmalate synthase
VYTAISDVTHPTARDREQAVEAIAAMVRRARHLAADVEFSLQNATRTDPVVLAAAVRAALSGGASTINVTDAGFILFDELTLCLSRLRRDVPELAGAILSFHGHDDLGVATANAIAAVSSGARQLEVAVNGVGDVGGNTSLQEVAEVLRVHGDRWSVETTLEPRGLRALSELVDARRRARLRNRAT